MVDNLGKIGRVGNGGCWILSAVGGSALRFEMLDTRFSCGKSGFGLPKGSSTRPASAGLQHGRVFDFASTLITSSRWMGIPDKSGFSTSILC